MNGGLVQGEISPSNQQKISSPKSKRFWFVLIAFLAVILLIGGFVVWTSYLSPEAKSERETRLNYEKATKALSDFETAMKNDTYGGKTPQETLDMFIDALKKGDIELASRYFAFETGGINYLNRKNVIDALQLAKNEGRFKQIISVVENARSIGYSDNYTWYKRAFTLQILDSNSALQSEITLVFNHLSGVWKIESL